MRAQKIKVSPKIDNRKELNGFEYGIIETDAKIAIVPDHYITWIMKIKKINPNKNNGAQYEVIRILGLYTNSQLTIQ